MSTEMDKRSTGRFLRTDLKESFSFKLFRSFAVAIVVILMVFTPLFAYFQKKAVEQELMKEGQMLAGLLAYNSRAGVFAERAELLEDAVQGIMNQKNVAAVSVYTAENDMLISQPKQLQAHDPGLKGDEKGTLPKPEEGKLFEIVEKEKTISVLTPVILETSIRPAEALYFDEPVKEKHQSVIGYVRVTMSKDALYRETRSILLRSGMIALVFLFSGAVVTYLTIIKVTGPLTRLNEAVNSLGSGASVEKVQVESQDEIGKLAMSFNTMYDNLKKREEEKAVLEERLRLSQKMEAVGTLARGIAHDFNNILSTVQGSVFLLEKKMDLNSNLRHYVNQMHGSLNKAKNLIQGLITFSRIQKISPATVDLNSLVTKMRPMLAGIAGEDINIEISVSEGELKISADSMQIEQVLMNLCSNSRDAMPDGGTFSVMTQTVAIPDDITISLGKPPGNYALIRVSDTGTGMDEEVKDRIFEPFFTTKEVGRGTGLGLSIVFGIIEYLKGYIDVYTKKGEETVFAIYIPMLEKDDEKAHNR